MGIVIATEDNLNSIMEFESVTRSFGDGSVFAHVSGVYAPEVLATSSPNGPADTEILDDGWTLLSGFSGQYSYSGPIMHNSEYIGGGMADHIIATPGFYAVVEVRDSDGSFSDGDPIGWAVAYRASV